MKRIILFLGAATLSAMTYSAPIGTYVGVSGGRSMVKTPDSNPFTVSSNGTTTKTLTGWAERAFTGYNVNPFFGLEVGYTNYARSLYNARTPSGNSQMKYNFRSYDALGKAYLPLGYSGLNLYVLAGVSRVTETLNYTDGGVPLSGSVAPINAGVSHSYKTRPLYGVGINMTFMNHITADVEATQVYNLGSFSSDANAIPFLNLLTLGVAYNFC